MLLMLNSELFVDFFALGQYDCLYFKILWACHCTELHLRFFESNEIS